MCQHPQPRHVAKSLIKAIVLDPTPAISVSAASPIEEIRATVIVLMTTSARPNLDTASTFVTTRSAIFRRSGPNCPLGPHSVTKQPLSDRPSISDPSADKNL